MNLSTLKDWVPFRFFSRDGGLLVDWAFLGRQRFTESFFEQTIGARLRRRADLLFRHQTSLDILEELYTRHRAPEPAGFIFHMSRCGSTLVSQMLAALEQNIVISEARPIDQVLESSLPLEARAQWLRWTINALVQPRFGERYSFVKFDAWHVAQIPTIVHAFPTTPWIFLYRDPVEVLVSQQRERGVQVIPGFLNAIRLGLDQGELSLDYDEYAAIVLGRFCELACQHLALGGRLVNFTELPDAVPDLLLKFFCVECTEQELLALSNAAQFNAKAKGVYFQPDSAAKQREATATLRELAARFMTPAYEKLEALRKAQPSLD
jgi:hypothetical protein